MYSGKAAVEGYERVLSQAFDLTDAIWIVVLIIATVALMNMLMMSKGTAPGVRSAARHWFQ